MSLSRSKLTSKNGRSFGGNYILSESCAIQTGRQIDSALEAGWAGIGLNPIELTDERSISRKVDDLLPKIVRNLEMQRPTIVYTARGHAMSRDAFADISPILIGKAFASIMISARAQTPVPRVVLAGGDSSSYSIRYSGAEALTIKVFDEAQHSHLRELSCPDNNLDRLEILLKGGQIGRDDYLLRALTGSSASPL